MSLIKPIIKRKNEIIENPCKLKEMCPCKNRPGCNCTCQCKCVSILY